MLRIYISDYIRNGAKAQNFLRVGTLEDWENVGHGKIPNFVSFKVA